MNLIQDVIVRGKYLVNLCSCYFTLSEYHEAYMIADTALEELLQEMNNTEYKKSLETYSLFKNLLYLKGINVFLGDFISLKEKIKESVSYITAAIKTSRRFRIGLSEIPNMEKVLNDIKSKEMDNIGLSENSEQLRGSYLIQPIISTPRKRTNSVKSISKKKVKDLSKNISMLFKNESDMDSLESNDDYDDEEEEDEDEEQTSNSQILSTISSSRGSKQINPCFTESKKRSLHLNYSKRSSDNFPNVQRGESHQRETKFKSSNFKVTPAKKAQSSNDEDYKNRSLSIPEAKKSKNLSKSQKSITDLENEEPEVIDLEKQRNLKLEAFKIESGKEVISLIDKINNEVTQLNDKIRDKEVALQGCKDTVQVLSTVEQLITSKKNFQIQQEEQYNYEIQKQMDSQNDIIGQMNNSEREITTIVEKVDSIDGGNEQQIMEDDKNINQSKILPKLSIFSNNANREVTNLTPNQNISHISDTNNFEIHVNQSAKRVSSKELDYSIVKPPSNQKIESSQNINIILDSNQPTQNSTISFGKAKNNLVNAQKNTETNKSNNESDLPPIIQNKQNQNSVSSSSQDMEESLLAGKTDQNRLQRWEMSLFNYRDIDNPRFIADNSLVLVQDFQINIQKMLDDFKIGFGKQTLSFSKKLEAQGTKYAILLKIGIDSKNDLFFSVDPTYDEGIFDGKEYIFKREILSESDFINLISKISVVEKLLPIDSIFTLGTFSEIIEKFLMPSLNIQDINHHTDQEQMINLEVWPIDINILYNQKSDGQDQHTTNWYHHMYDNNIRLFIHLMDHDDDQVVQVRLLLRIFLIIELYECSYRYCSRSEHFQKFFCLYRRIR